MPDKNEMTALDASDGADAEQSSQNHIDSIVTDNPEEINDFDEDFEKYEQEYLRMLEPSYLKTVTMPELYSTIFETQPPLIDGLLCRGTYLFVGSPKVGKSFTMAQIAYHISTGTPLWNFNVRQATVLYLALEDDYPRLQQRLYRMFGTEETEHLHFATHSKKLGEGLEEQINGFIDEHPTTGLVIIDTLKRIRESAGADYSYSSDYDIVAKLKAIADSRKITMIIVHHTRKQQADDKFDMISGTNGLLGAADGAMVLSKNKRTDTEASLDITGRDQQDIRLNLERDTERLTWDVVSVDTELWRKPPDPLLEKLAAYFHEKNMVSWVTSATKLCEELELDIKPNTATKRLNINAGRLLNEYGIEYTSYRVHAGRMIRFNRAEPRA